MSDTVELVAGDARARIALVGAEPIGWTAGGRELLWAADPAVWARTSPVLFPIVGRAAGGIVRVDGRAYPMGIHGFAAESRFELVEYGPDRVRLALEDDVWTRASYQFTFRLTVEYTLADCSLSARFGVTNRGDVSMPYALGLHPGFRWPFAAGPRDRYVVEFAAEEEPRVPVITSAGLFSSERRPIPLDGRRLAVNDALMSREALCFLHARSRSARFIAPDRSAIQIAVDDFPHLALWSRPPAPFLCIEAWTGHGDPDGFVGDLSDKPSMRMLAPGAIAHHSLTMSWTPAS